MVKKKGTDNVYALKTLNKEVVAKRNLLVKTQGKSYFLIKNSREVHFGKDSKPLYRQPTLRIPDRIKVVLRHGLHERWRAVLSS